MNKAHNAPIVIGTGVPDAGVTPPMPPGWIDVEAVAALCYVSVSQAKRYLSAWEADVLAGKPAPRTQRWHTGRRGRPPLLAFEADVRAHLGLDDVAEAQAA